MKATFKAIIASLLLAVPAAQAVVVDFDNAGLSHGSVITNQYDTSTYGNLTISATNAGGGPNRAVAFDTNANGTADPDLEDPIGEPFDLKNVLIIQENDTGCSSGTCTTPDDEGTRPAGHFTLDFGGVIELLSIDFIDIELAENGNTEPTNAILLYDENDNLITFGTSNTELEPYPFHTPHTGNNTWGQVLFDSILFPEVKSIGKIEVFMGGSGAIDNISFNVVPLPASVWLFGTALVGFIGFARRRSI